MLKGHQIDTHGQFGNGRPRISPDGTLAPLSGRMFLERLTDPGLKPWAESYCPFGAQNKCSCKTLKLTLARSPGLFSCAISWQPVHRSRLAAGCHLPVGQMIPVAAGLSLTSNCRRSLHKDRPCPPDLAQEKVSSFRSDFRGLLLLNRVFQSASLHALDLPYKSPAVFGTLSTEVIHYSYSPPFIDKFVRHLGCAGPDDRIPKESLASAPRF